MKSNPPGVFRVSLWVVSYVSLEEPWQKNRPPPQDAVQIRWLNQATEQDLASELPLGLLGFLCAMSVRSCNDTTKLLHLMEGQARACKCFD